MASEVGLMEKRIVIEHHQPQQQQYHKQQILKCPRCDSSNTKFCYYNNHSLSQPRHFCKTCKRYWTRGGTLRNVPVGGSCRKNKRVKMPSITTATTTNTTKHAASTSQPVHDNPNRISNTNFDHLSSLYSFLPQNPKYHGFSTVSSGLNFSQPAISSLGLGLPPSDPAAGALVNNSQNSSLFLSEYPSSFFAGSTSSSVRAPILASLLASGFQQPQRYMDWKNQFQDQNNHDQIEAMASSDPNSLLWNTISGGWFDPTNNIDSSVSSLI